MGRFFGKKDAIDARKRKIKEDEEDSEDDFEEEDLQLPEPEYKPVVKQQPIQKNEEIKQQVRIIEQEINLSYLNEKINALLQNQAAIAEDIKLIKQKALEN